MAQMTELGDKDIKSVIITVVHMFQTLEENLRRNIEDVKKNQMKFLEIKKRQCPR